MLLFRVFTQIVEFQRLVWLDGNSLPVTVAGSTLLAWEFPIENSVVCINLLTIEQWQDMHAVDVLRQMSFMLHDSSSYHVVLSMI